MVLWVDMEGLGVSVMTQTLIVHWIDVLIVNWDEMEGFPILFVKPVLNLN